MGLCSATRTFSRGPSKTLVNTVRLNSGDARGSFSRQAARRRTVKEAAMAPSEGTAISMGQGAVAGGAALGLGALAFYGLGMSSEAGAVDGAVAWPQYVRDRVRDTYFYFGSSLAATAGTAAAIYRSPAAMNLVNRGGFIAMGVSIAAMIGSSMVARSIPYTPGVGAKQAAWLAHCAVVGAVIAPICLLGGPILTRAAWYTAGMVGGLSTVAVCAPSDKFLYMGGPLAMGLGVVFCASIASNFLPPGQCLDRHLHGHRQHLHQDCHDAGQWREQEEVNENYVQRTHSHPPKPISSGKSLAFHAFLIADYQNSLLCLWHCTTDNSL